MKRFIYVFLAVCVLGVLFSLTGSKKDERFQTTFPLEEEVVTATLEKTGLPGIISESETDSYRKGHIQYVVRSPTETYDGTNNSLFFAYISSANYEGERMLFTLFDQSVDSEQIVWEDWKQQIVFATLLYGGFENEEEVYQAFLEKEVPKDFFGKAVELPGGYSRVSYRGDVQLPEGYCRVSYTFRSRRTYDEDGFPTRKQSASLRVDIYESYELYQKLNTNQQGETSR
ncbi:hypothetical protein [Oscillibacter sp.]|uniref:hypothetical protein n=1 Tax=Oscillibacter sp. TaxID=1945593 RepID=UPI00289E4434|nr:hypothetical protein [Oscillibacter sp.]